MTHDRPSVDDLLDQWEASQEQDHPVSVTQLAQPWPELRDELQRRVNALQEMAWLDGPVPDPIPPVPPASSVSFSTSPNNTARRFQAAQQEPLEPDHASLPETLGERYRLNHRVAAGGFGEVWSACDSLLERKVAIKLTRFNCLEEARKAAKLHHPGIVAVHDVGQEANYCYIVYDMVNGNDLAAELALHAFTPAQAVDIVAQAAEHLDHAHRHDLIHRDLKPANLLLDETGSLYITDFGVAVTGREVQEGSVQTSGTLAYMAPEQLADNLGPISPAVDIYGLGATLFELITQRKPFVGKDILDTRLKILTEPAPLLSDIVPDIPPGLDAICQRCLSKKASDRYPTALDLARDLRDLALMPIEQTQTSPYR